jgi:hypothetical protein
MVTLTGLEPATSPVPQLEQGRSIPLELQRHHNPHDSLVAVHWNTFGYWVRHYWSLSSDYIEKMSKTKTSIWADFTSLQKKLNKIEHRKRGIAPRPTDPELEKFLDEEIGSTVAGP